MHGGRCICIYIAIHVIIHYSNSGSGIYRVLEMASEFPSCEFHGIDLCAMFPTSIKPQNARFTQHNFLEKLPFPDSTFDYIHMRSMLCSLTRQQLNRLLKEISRVLKPLGYIEIVDVEYRVQRAGPLTEEYLNQKCKHPAKIFTFEKQTKYDF